MKKPTTTKKPTSESKDDIMTTNNAIGILTNSNTKLDACVNHICEGAPLLEPALVSDPDFDPNPDIPEGLEAKVKENKDQIDYLFTWAQAHAK